MSGTVQVGEAAPVAWDPNTAYTVNAPASNATEDYILCVTREKSGNATCGGGLGVVPNGPCPVTVCQSFSVYNDGLNCQSNCEMNDVDVCGISVDPQLTLACSFFSISVPIDLVGAEIEMIHLKEREYIFKKMLSEICDDYDYILIDCSPSLGLLTLNALTAADSVIIPIQCEYFALEGLWKLLNTIKSVQKIHNEHLDIEGLLLTMYDSRLRLSNQVVEEVQSHFTNMVFKTIIQRNIRLSEAPSHGESIIYYDVNSKGATNYLSLAKEIISKQ